MVYLKIWGGTQPYVAFLTLEFNSCYLFLVEHTLHRILLQCISQYLSSCVMSLLVGSWIELVFLVLQSKR
jgi:hypothetical protein